jgi:hypothetical protein
VTAQEVVGKWVLSTNSMRAIIIDGFQPMKGEQLSIIIRSNGSCFFQQPVETRFGKKPVVGIVEGEGTWALKYDPKGHSKNSLLLSSPKAGTYLSVASNANQIVLWKYWADPDEGIHLVYEKVTGEAE